MFDRADERAFMSEVSAVVERDVRVGIDEAPPVPMQLGNPETGDFRGYELDLLGEIARRAEFRLSYRRALWSAIVSELMTGEVDLICQLLWAQVVTLASRVFMKSKIA
jgi:ABC-type amino acid transport substrate-binding protein